MTILDQIKQQTQDLHDRVEGRMPLMRPDLILEQYQAVLQRLYGFYQPLEERLSACVWSDTTFDPESRQKTPLLVRDLQVLDPVLDWAALPVCGNLPEVGGPARGLGCAYVLEGSTLGGQIIARHVELTLGLGPDRGTAFFHSYGSDVGARWRAFRQVLLTYLTTPARQDAAIHAARETFQAFERWVIEL